MATASKGDKPRYKDNSDNGRALNDALRAEKVATKIIEELKPVVYNTMVKEKGEEDIIVELDEFIINRSVTAFTEVDVNALSEWCPDYKEKLAVMRATAIEEAIREAGEKLRRKLLDAPPTEAEFDVLVAEIGLGDRAVALKKALVTPAAKYMYNARVVGRGV